MAAVPRATAAHASVVFLKIPEFPQAAVAEQVRLKDRLEGMVAAALAGLDEARRIVLEAPDGAAIVVLGDPAGALRFARRAAAGEGAVAVASGITHGPVRVAEGGTTPVVLGDAIAVADAVAGFASPGRVAATREFRDALVQSAPSNAWYLASAGTHTDARDRSYEIYFADERAAAARRRRVLLAVAGVAAAIVAVGFAAREFLGDVRQGPAPGAAVAMGKTAAPEGAVAAPRVAPPPALATLRLEIRPQGELFVDGVSKGKSPPLVSLQLPPGKHRIEIRRAGARPLVLQVDPGPGEELVIRHAFPVPPPKSAWRKFFDQFK